MNLLRELLEADITLPKDQYQQTKDDPNVAVNFEHALHKDLSQLVVTLKNIQAKLNNEDLLKKVEATYNKVNNLPEEKFPVLNNHDSGRDMSRRYNPLFELSNNLKEAIITATNAIEDLETLSKY